MGNEKISEILTFIKENPGHTSKDLNLQLILTFKFEGHKKKYIIFYVLNR